MLHLALVSSSLPYTIALLLFATTHHTCVFKAQRFNKVYLYLCRSLAPRTVKNQTRVSRLSDRKKRSDSSYYAIDPRNIINIP